MELPRSLGKREEGAGMEVCVPSRFTRYRELPCISLSLCRYGPKRDNRRKIHPMMLPYARLSEEDKCWDFTTAEEAVKVIRALGFRVKRGEALTSVTSNLSEDMLRRTMVPLGPPPESNLASPLLEPLEGRGRLLSDAVSPDGSGDFSGTIVPSRPSAVSAHRSSLRITTGALDVARPRTASRMSQKDNSPESTSREEVPMLILGSKSLTEEEAVRVSLGLHSVFCLYFVCSEQGALYLPRPFDTAGVKIAQDMKELVDLLARHFHEVWARDKLKQGWKFAPDRVQVCAIPPTHLSLLTLFCCGHAVFEHVFRRRKRSVTPPATRK